MDTVQAHGQKLDVPTCISLMKYDRLVIENEEQELRYYIGCDFIAVQKNEQKLNVPTDFRPSVIEEDYRLIIEDEEEKYRYYLRYDFIRERGCTCGRRQYCDCPCSPDCTRVSHLSSRKLSDKKW
jgi:hypothetical protein